MNESALVLLVSDSPANTQTVRDILAAGGNELAVQHIERLRTASARIAGGGVALVLLDLHARSAGAAALEAFSTLRQPASETPLLVLCEAEEEALALQMIKEGAFGYVVRSMWERDLKRRVLERIAGRDGSSNSAPSSGHKKACPIAVVGAKGGVGSTTVAANIASVLTSSASVILAELRPPFGSLCHFFRPHRSVPGLGRLLAMDARQIDAAQVESCLWPNRSIPGLKVLFGPEKPGMPDELGPRHAKEILRRLSELADTVVVDLPGSLTHTDQAVLSNCDTLLLVVERDALSVDAAKAKISLLEEHGVVPREAGVVIVNRVPLATPMSLADIEKGLGLPVFGVIPPAADLCASAYRVHTPVVKLDPQSLMTASLVQLAQRFQSAATLEFRPAN